MFFWFTIAALFLLGIALSFRKKRSSHSGNSYTINPALLEENMWDGPAPSDEERKKNQRFIYNHIQQYNYGGQTALEKLYPDAAKVAIASKRYNELNRLLKEGKIEPKAYEDELEKILPLINLSEDLN